MFVTSLRKSACFTDAHRTSSSAGREWQKFQMNCGSLKARSDEVCGLRAAHRVFCSLEQSGRSKIPPVRNAQGACRPKASLQWGQGGCSGHLQGPGTTDQTDRRKSPWVPAVRDDDTEGPDGPPPGICRQSPGGESVWADWDWVSATWWNWGPEYKLNSAREKCRKLFLAYLNTWTIYWDFSLLRVYKCHINNSY